MHLQTMFVFVGLQIHIAKLASLPKFTYDWVGCKQ